jgi:hypothetical protein
MALGGWPEGPPVLPPTGLPARLDALVDEIECRTAERGHPVRVSWAAMLSGRAGLLDLGRRGRTSPNGTCRLLRAADGWVALNLARADDVTLVPALTGVTSTDPWDNAARAAARTAGAEFVTRARLLGLAAAPLPEPSPPIEADACTIVDRSGRRTDGDGESWQVVDLSSLWAGPVAARVLAAAGAAVIKVESSSRPDGARATPAFYRWVHSEDDVTVTVDLASEAGRERVAALIDGADVVIEGSRPRALEQLGLGPADRPGRAGQVWLSITGYGRDEPGRDSVAFGDDAAVAGGLVGWDEAGEPVFCGDAIADPLTGLAGALAVLRARDTGGGQLIDLAMARMAAAMADGLGPPPAGQADQGVAVVADGTGGWQVRAGDTVEAVRAGPPSLEWVSAGGRSRLQ